ncbi:MAG TPA: hypothetical protein V6C78_20430 [Crinalium sp.]|jgi:hypothetical protein
MLKIKPKRITYHGWQIQVLMQDGKFCFRCYPPNLADFCNDGSSHISFKGALAAACHFVNREVAILALLRAVDEWLEDGRINEDEYWNLTNFN